MLEPMFYKIDEVKPMFEPTYGNEANYLKQYKLISIHEINVYGCVENGSV